jgi:hypothetical protein
MRLLEWTTTALHTDIKYASRGAIPDLSGSRRQVVHEPGELEN